MQTDGSHVETYLAGGGADPQQRALARDLVPHQHDNSIKFLRDPFITCYFGWLLRGFQVSNRAT